MIDSINEQETSHTFPVVSEKVLAIEHLDRCCRSCAAEKLSFSVECSGCEEIVCGAASHAELCL